MVRPELASTFLGRLSINPLAVKTFSRDHLLLSCWARAGLLTPPDASHYEVLRSSWATLSRRAGLVAAGEGDVVLQLLTQLGTGHGQLVRTVTDDLTGLVKMGTTTAALARVYQVTLSLSLSTR